MIWPTDYLNQVICGDCLAVLKTMPYESVNCCITSPPYWGLRDYGVNGQFGLEKTPEEYVEKMVEVFKEVRRVLKNDGTCWINLGDTYVQNIGMGFKPTGGRQRGTLGTKNPFKNPNKHKDLCGIPWMVAFALRNDGWYLRQDIIWAKPNPMPESVTDRCTKAHEYIFLLTKSDRYFFDGAAIREPSATNDTRRPYGSPGANALDPRGKQGEGKQRGKGGRNVFRGQGHFRDGENGPANREGRDMRDVGAGEVRNRRSVWTVATKPFSEAHFATFPPDLIEPMVLAGCPENGVILDPFMGAGTTGMVAKMNYRNYIGVELNQKYIDIANKRIAGTLVNKKLNFS